MQKHIIIAVPAYTHVVHIGTMHSLLHDCLQLAKRGDVVAIDDECGSTELPDIRAATVARFLTLGGTHLVHIDNDVAWEPGALVRLVDHPVDVVGGVYPRREDPISFPVRYVNGEVPRPCEYLGLVELEAMPGGFVRYTRAALERMAESYSDLAYQTSRYEGLTLPGFWRELVIDGRKKGEDLAFFHRWRSIGGQVWADPNITMAHAGPKVFVGRFSNALKELENGKSHVD